MFFGMVIDIKKGDKIADLGLYNLFVGQPFSRPGRRVAFFMRKGLMV